MLLQGRLLAKLYAYMRKHEKGFEGCIEGLALLIGADGQSPTKEDAFMHLAEALEEQNPDMEAVEELLGFYAADDDEGVSRVRSAGWCWQPPGYASQLLHSRALAL